MGHIATTLLLLSILCIAPDAVAQVPGLVEALSLDGIEGDRIEIPGPPSELRHPELDDPQRANNSGASAHAFMQTRRDLPGGAYQECRENWLTTRHPDAVMTGAWSIPGEGRVVLLFVNVTDQFVIATLQVDGSTYGLKEKRLTRTGLGVNTTVTPQEVDSVFEETIHFAPLAAWGIEISQ